MLNKISRSVFLSCVLAFHYTFTYSFSHNILIFRRFRISNAITFFTNDFETKITAHGRYPLILPMTDEL